MGYGKRRRISESASLTRSLNSFVKRDDPVSRELARQQACAILRRKPANTVQLLRNLSPQAIEFIEHDEHLRTYLRR